MARLFIVVHAVRALAVVLVFAAAGFAQDVARMELLVQSLTPDNRFMGTALVARGENILLSKGYGSANLEWDIANTPATKFRIGSITKQFTAAAILLLEERGRLSVEDAVRKHLPDAPAAWEKITASPKVLAQYVGTYQVGPGANLVIRLDGDQLTAQLGDQPRLPIFAESETRFFLRAVDAQLDFVEDDKGVLSHAVMHQNGRDTGAARIP